MNAMRRPGRSTNLTERGWRRSSKHGLLHGTNLHPISTDGVCLFGGDTGITTHDSPDCLLEVYPNDRLQPPLIDRGYPRLVLVQEFNSWTSGLKVS